MMKHKKQTAHYIEVPLTSEMCHMLLARKFPYQHLHMYTRGSILATVFLLNLYQFTCFTFMWFTFTSQEGNGYTDFLGWSSG